MKAVIQYEFGNANVLTYTEVDKPTIGEKEVLIKAAYTSVNYADIKKRVGNKGKGKFPLMLGLDVAGVVEEVGPRSPFSVGDRVIAFPNNGSYAEYVVAKESLVYKIPDSLGFEQAAAMPTVSILSYMLLHEIAQVKPSDTIVIHSAGGGVGSMLVQLAKHAGVNKIIGTVGNFAKASYVKKLGADVVCTYETFSEEVLKETNGAGAHVIFDSIAGEVTGQSLECLAFYGTLVQFGNSSGKAGTIRTSDVHSSCRNLRGFSLGTTRERDPERLKPVAEKVIERFASGEVSIPIAQVFPLKETALAHQLVESRQYQGKILIKM
ncbi:quinone oxidoreductase family protein [Mesobacillus maritimus]|uniref:Zinc-binding dehydrogenase n=1 Tax=Mesobacillus maritimus TaxID=1643336 RepID=A0ABS7K0G4_9BACI|nr:zinc-binding dehydrogenase [Mesobacillus maritimus]MBY0095711.1 zinc-binding dehydrogenase [Mesobacillus maritimus]